MTRLNSWLISVAWIWSFQLLTERCNRDIWWSHVPNREVYSIYQSLNTASSRPLEHYRQVFNPIFLIWRVMNTREDEYWHDIFRLFPLSFNILWKGCVHLSPCSLSTLMLKWIQSRLLGIWACLGMIYL